MFNKKCVVSISTYTIILLILVLVFIGTYSSYISNKKDSLTFKYEKDLFISLTKFRSEIINIVERNNSKIDYIDKYSINSVNISINGNKLCGMIIESDGYAKLNISTLGLPFCSNYSFYPKVLTTFIFNGSCILIN